MNHQLESRMREICLYGSEGGGSSRFSLPLSDRAAPPPHLDTGFRRYDGFEAMSSPTGPDFLGKATCGSGVDSRESGVRVFTPKGESNSG